MSALIDFGPVSDLASRVGKSGSGTYLYMSSKPYVCGTGELCMKLTLEDATGRITGFARAETRSRVDLVEPMSPVRVLGTVQLFGGEPQIMVRALSAERPEAVGCATDLLPRWEDSDEALSAIKLLAELELSLPSPLDGFLKRVLLDPQLGIPFVRCRASVSHHHAYPGGLLVHSTAMLEHARKLTEQILPHDEWSPHIAQLGYLLHDIGKLHTVGQTRRPLYALVVGHEHLATELLAPHLAWLDGHDRESATALRYVFAYLAKPANSRGIAGYAVAEIIEKLDQFSAATHNKRDLKHLLEESWQRPNRPAHINPPFPSGSRGHLRAVG